MNLHHIAYHLHRPPPSYSKMTGQAEERDLRNERVLEFKEQIAKLMIRKPLQLIERITAKIHKQIYKMSLEDLIEELKQENLEYDEDLIDLETRTIYN